MDGARDTIAARARGAAIVCSAALGLAIVMTWPLARGLGRLGRTTTMDGLYSIWNVAWVAHALVTDPAALFDANIFYPHRRALAYSESNIIAGIVGVPAWLITGNAYAAHNTAVLFAFASTLVGAWLLLRRLSGNSAAAAVGAVLFAFCPYFYSHSAHIQLLMAGGIPLSMLALHRLVDRPTLGRGLTLGAALGTQALACAYYGIFAGLMVGYAVLFFAARRRLWRTLPFWTAVAAGAVSSIVIVLPFFLPYLDLQRNSGFARSLDDASRYSATWLSYLVSPAHAHRPLLSLARGMGWRISEVLFPGAIVIVLGAIGAALSLRRSDHDPQHARDRETVLLYGSLGILAFWASFGPAAGLYTLLYRAVPPFTFLRAPSRFGLLLPMVLAVFSALALRRVPALAGSRRALVASALGAVAIAELNVAPFPWERALTASANYTVLAGMPKGVVAEFPFYGERVAYPLHAQYMMFSTTHWMPLVNGYSDYIPPDFRQTAFVLDSFPSNDTFAILQKHRVRYIGVHWDMYGPRAEEVRKRLESFLPHLRPLGSDARMTLYEVVSFP
jgi:hypothetical protein